MSKEANIHLWNLNEFVRRSDFDYTSKVAIDECRAIIESAVSGIDFTYMSKCDQVGDSFNYQDYINYSLRTVFNQFIFLSNRIQGEILETYREIICGVTDKLYHTSVNPQYLFTYEQFVEQQKSHDITPIVIGELDTIDSFYSRLKTLHKELIIRSKIDCSIDSLQNIFTLKASEIKQIKELINWNGNVNELGYLLKHLSDSNIINNKGFYQKAATCFLVKGRPTSSINLKGNTSKTDSEFKEFVKDVIKKIS